MTRGIDVTVAAIIERDGKFLMVEERVGRQSRLEPTRRPSRAGRIAARCRDARGARGDGPPVRARGVVGFYLWHSQDAATTYLRIAFCGTVEPSADVAALDDGIVAVHWLSRAQLVSRARQLRSPMVLRCIDDYLAGHRYPLDCLAYLDPRAAELDERAFG